MVVGTGLKVAYRPSDDARKLGVLGLSTCILRQTCSLRQDECSHTIDTNGYWSIAARIAANSASRLSAHTCSRFSLAKAEDAHELTSLMPASFGCRIAAMVSDLTLRSFYTEACASCGMQSPVDKGCPICAWADGVEGGTTSDGVWEFDSAAGGSGRPGKEASASSHAARAIWLPYRPVVAPASSQTGVLHVLLV